MEESGRAPRPTNGSFWGGAGASSAGVGVGSTGASPNGPRGSTESSTDSSLVACALILRVPRGTRLPGARTAGELSDAGACAAAKWSIALSEGSWREQTSHGEHTASLSIGFGGVLAWFEL